MSRREFAVWYAEGWLGRWYTWGGDDPAGIDCSGLVVEVGKAAGVLPRGKKWDATANDLLLICGRKGWLIGPHDVRPGCWVFYLSEESVAIHVEIVSRHPQVSIGASGGGSRVRSLEDAIRENAFIKARPWRSRGQPGAWQFADPFRKEELESVGG